MPTTPEPIRQATRPPKNIVAARVRQARYRQKPRVSQADLAALLTAYGVTITQAAISKIEAGIRPVYDFEVKALAEALAVRVGWLVDEEDL